MLFPYVFVIVVCFEFVITLIKKKLKKSNAFFSSFFSVLYLIEQGRAMAL